MVKYINYESPITLKCKICNNIWNCSYKVATNKPICPNCKINSKVYNIEKRGQKTNIPKKNIYEKTLERTQRYISKIDDLGKGNIAILEYTNSVTKTKAKCNVCKYEWYIRPDHLLERPYCPICKKK